MLIFTLVSRMRLVLPHKNHHPMLRYLNKQRVFLLLSIYLCQKNHHSMLKSSGETSFSYRHTSVKGTIVKCYDTRPSAACSHSRQHTFSEEETHNALMIELEPNSSTVTHIPAILNISKEPSPNEKSGSPSIITDSTQRFNLEAILNLPNVSFADISPLLKTSFL